MYASRKHPRATADSLNLLKYCTKPPGRGIFLCMKGYIEKTASGFRVRYGRKIQKRFPSLEQAERFLTGLRFKEDEGTLDRRDYSKANPLAFERQVERWLDTKTVSRSHKRNLAHWVEIASKAWAGRNCKSIRFGDIEDLIAAQSFGQKTKSEMAGCLRQFFAWLEKREGIPAPEIPKIEFTLGWREIIDMETQNAILEELRRIAPFRIWLGIKWLATYVSIRPNEMRNLRERDVNLNGALICRPETTKEKKPKIVPMLDEDIALVRSLPRGLPDLYFFRREKGRGVYGVGEQIGRTAFYHWWCRACLNLGISGVDMYGGTRHSSASAMREFFTKEEMRAHGTMHGTNKALERYFQGEAAPSRKIYEKIRSSSGRPGTPRTRAGSE